MPQHSLGHPWAKGKSAASKKSGAVLSERAVAGWKSWEETRPLAKERSKWKRSGTALRATQREKDR